MYAAIQCIITPNEMLTAMKTAKKNQVFHKPGFPNFIIKRTSTVPMSTLVSMKKNDSFGFISGGSPILVSLYFMFISAPTFSIFTMFSPKRNKPNICVNKNIATMSSVTCGLCFMQLNLRMRF